MFTFLGVQWDIRSASFWVVVGLIFLILVAFVAILVLIGHRASLRRRKRLKEERQRKLNRMASAAEGIYHFSVFRQDDGPRSLYTSADLADRVEEYIDEVIRRSEEAKMQAAKHHAKGPVYCSVPTPDFFPFNEKDKY